MIEGVHADTVAFVDFKHAAGLLEVPGWTWLGQEGKYSTRQVKLTGTPPLDGLLRVTRFQVLKQGVTCTVSVESRQAVPGTVLIRGEIKLGPAASGNADARCLLSFDGLAARNLANTAGPASAMATRVLANDYARSLLEQVAGGLERNSAKLNGAKLNGAKLNGAKLAVAKLAVA
jgi:hypothetical protein